MSALELQDLRVNYGGIAALHGIDLQVGEGEIVALLGANGAGKTTTLRAMAGWSVEGAIRFDGTSRGAWPRMRSHDSACATSPKAGGSSPG